MGAWVWACLSPPVVVIGGAVAAAPLPALSSGVIVRVVARVVKATRDTDTDFRPFSVVVS